jgi:hypothetical protein
VAFVDDHQCVSRQVIEQRRRRLTRLPPREVSRVVLDALAETHFVQHLEVETRALFDALTFHELVVRLEPFDALGELGLDRVDRTYGGGARCHVMTRRINRVAADPLQDLSGERIENMDAFDFVIEQRDPHRCLRVLGWENVEHVASHPEHAAPELEIVALVLHLAEALDRIALSELLAFSQVQDHAVVFTRITNPVNAGYRRDDNRIAPLEQRLGRRKTHLLDVFVDARVLLDVQIFRWNVRFRLVVVVVRDKVLDSVFREELPHLGIELRRKRLVRSHDERWTSEPRNNMRHRVRLAGAGDTQQSLIRETVADAFDELLDRFRLIAGRGKGLMQAKRAVRKREDVGLRGTLDLLAGCHGAANKKG